MTIDEIRAFYGKDRYATEQTGIEILEGGKGTARCRLALDARHENSYGGVMGGVLFTLADYTFAIASNTLQRATVSLHASIQFHRMAPSRGVLYSEAKCLHDGKKTCAYLVSVFEEGGGAICDVTFTGCKLACPGLGESEE